jgi:anti-anti-sigma factor
MDVGTVVIEQDGRVWLLTLRGEHDSSVSPGLREELDRVFAAGSSVVVDLSEVEFIDSSVLGALTHGHQRAARERHRLAVVVPGADHPIARLLTMTGLTATLDTYTNRADAIAALGARDRRLSA